LARARSKIAVSVSSSGEDPPFPDNYGFSVLYFPYHLSTPRANSGELSGEKAPPYPGQRKKEE
jgi:hypothetical protein